MAPRRRKPPAPTGLRGGIGEDLATPGGVLAQTLDRLEVNRPTTTEYVRRQMLTKDETARKNVAEALLAAAFQHRVTPDVGSSMYGKAFLELPFANQKSLLELLDPADMGIVQEAFGAVMDSVPTAPDLPTAAPPTSTALSPLEQFKQDRDRALAVPQAKDRGLAASDRRIGKPGSVDATPDYDSLSVDAQRAAAQMAEIIDVIDDLKLAIGEEGLDEWMKTAKGQQLTSNMAQLSRAHPEAEMFANNPSLMTRPMPFLGDQNTPQAVGSEALPKKMRLGYLIKGQGDYRIEARPDRRFQPGGIYSDIPPDMPNRQAAKQLADAAEETRLGRPTEVYLPPTESVKDTLARPKDTELPDGQRMQRNLEDRRAPEVELSAEQSSLIDSELAEALAEMEAFDDSAPVVPVYDSTLEPGYTPFERETVREKLRNSATGSPSAVQRDRDYALREGRSKMERIQEKIFRMANEYVDTDTLIAPSEGGRPTVDRGYAAVMPDDVSPDIAQAMEDASEQAPKKARGRSASKKPTPIGSRQKPPIGLDGLVPVWRGNMHFQDGPNIVIRRPNAMEVAGLILDRIEMPDPGLAARIEGHVQVSMDALEPIKPKEGSRARRAASTVFEPSRAYKADLERAVQEARAPGDMRPLIDPQSEATARAYASQFGADAGFVPAPEAIPAPAAPALEGPNPFSRFRKGDTTVQSLLGLAAAAGVGGIAQAGEGQDFNSDRQPPQDRLAMAPRVRSTAKEIAARGEAAAKAAEAAKAAAEAAKAAELARQQAAQVAGTPGTPGTPGTATPAAAAVTPEVTALQQELAALKAKQAQEAAGRQQRKAARNASAQPAPAQTPADPTLEPADVPEVPKPPNRTYSEFFENDIGFNVGGAVGKALAPLAVGLARRPTQTALGGLGLAVGIPPLIQAYRNYLGYVGGDSDSKSDPAPAGNLDTQMNQLFQEETPAMPANPPPMQPMNPGVPGANIDRLRKMLQT